VRILSGEGGLEKDSCANREPLHLRVEDLSSREDPTSFEGVTRDKSGVSMICDGLDSRGAAYTKPI